MSGPLLSSVVFCLIATLRISHAVCFFLFVCACPISELALLTGARRAMSVRTSRGNFVDLFILERHDFDIVLAQHPSLRDELLFKVKGFLAGQQYAANREQAEEKL